MEVPDVEEEGVEVEEEVEEEEVDRGEDEGRGNDEEMRIYKDTHRYQREEEVRKPKEGKSWSRPKI